MANSEHLDILRQGVEVWNLWREDHPELRPDLVSANLSEINLRKINLSRVNLSGAQFTRTSLQEADLSWSTLSRAICAGANLSYANLSQAILFKARCDKALFCHTKLVWTDMTEAECHGADFNYANLSFASLNRAHLDQANLDQAMVYLTIFGDVNLSQVKGLETVRHFGPSTLGIDTIARSQGNIPDNFFRGAGVSDSFITYARSLIGHAIDYHSCFISYSSKDKAFAERIYADLQSNGVRCWFAPEDLKIGTKFRQRIDEAIHLQDKLLLLLSEHSITSEWVADEVEAAIEKEQQKHEMLFPVRLDDVVMQTTQAWAAKLRRSRHIGDFTQWKGHDAYQRAFERLLRDLKAEGNTKGEN